MKINSSECAVCEICVDVCPQGLIRKKAFKMIIKEGCDNCEECIEVCPVGAIYNEED